MTEDKRLPGKDWYGATHRPIVLENGGGVLWVPEQLDIDPYPHSVTQEMEDARDLQHEAFVKELMELMSKPVDEERDPREGTGCCFVVHAEYPEDDNDNE